MFDDEPGEALILFEINDIWGGRKALIVADDEAQAIARTRTLHHRHHSVGMLEDVILEVQVRDVQKMAVVNARWVKGFRFQKRPEAHECPRDYLLLRRVETLTEPLVGPIRSEWDCDGHAEGEWQAVDPREPMRPVRQLVDDLNKLRFRIG